MGFINLVKRLLIVDPDPVLQRRLEIVKMCETGQYTLQQIGDTYGVSRERIRQIYKKETGRKYNCHYGWRQKNPKMCLLCERKAEGFGLCQRHYEHYRYSTDPEYRERHAEAMKIYHLKNREQRLTKMREYGRQYRLRRKLDQHLETHYPLCYE